MSTARLLGVLCLACSLHASLDAQIWFRSHPEPDGFSRQIMNAAGDSPVVGDMNSYAAGPALIAGVVSLRELQHPIPTKALREAYQAQEFAHTNKIPEAIAKLEDAIRIAPEYRDAHVNLGVQNARVGRLAEARTQLEKALEIGPPVAAIYFDLALVALDLGQARDAETYAKKALELGPADQGAKSILQHALTH